MPENYDRLNKARFPHSLLCQSAYIFGLPRHERHRLAHFRPPPPPPSVQCYRIGVIEIDGLPINGVTTLFVCPGHAMKARERCSYGYLKNSHNVYVGYLETEKTLHLTRSDLQTERWEAKFIALTEILGLSRSANTWQLFSLPVSTRQR